MQPIHIQRKHLFLGILLLLFVLSLLGVSRLRQAVRAESSTSYVLCQSVVNVYWPDRRFLLTLWHGPGERQAAIRTSLDRFGHDDLPPKPWPEAMHFGVAGTGCFDSWEALFEELSAMPFSFAGMALDPTAVPGEASYRQAALRLLFRDQYEIADALFPLADAAGQAAPLQSAQDAASSE